MWDSIAMVESLTYRIPTNFNLADMFTKKHLDKRIGAWCKEYFMMSLINFSSISLKCQSKTFIRTSLRLLYKYNHVYLSGWRIE